jgi:rare lipoprotein A
MLKKIGSIVGFVIYGSLTGLAISDTQALETGLASYYSDRFQGHRTASGAKYDRNKLTAAHRSLPIGSKIAVTNLRTKNSVIVTINDRGPYGGHRKLDLSYAAAKEIGLVAMGVAPVTYELVSATAKDSDLKTDFEQVIPREYTPGVLEVAKSEEEQIEAEEEVVSPESQTPPTIVISEEPPADAHPLPHKAQKLTAPESDAPPSKRKKQAASHAEKDPHPNKSKKHSKSHAEKDAHPGQRKKQADSRVEKDPKAKKAAATHDSKPKQGKAKTGSQSKKSAHK